MTLLQSWLTRLIVGGFLCFLVTAAAGKGAALIGRRPIRAWFFSGTGIICFRR